LDFAPLTKAIARVQASAKIADTALAALETRGYGLSAEQSIALDAQMVRTERVMLKQEGLPRRPWYRHQIYAPGFYTGYGVKTLPGVREAMEQRNWAEATEQVNVVSKTLDAMSAQIDRATAIVSSR